jgi:hypothetical protein
MRFLIDPDGLFDLVDALTTHYHPVKARETFYRFERLMRVYLTTPERAPYQGFDLSAWLGDDFYWQCLDTFCSKLVDFEFDGDAWQLEPNDEGRLVAAARRLTEFRQQLTGKPIVPFRLTLPRKGLKSVKYFSNRAELISLATSFVDDLFLNAAQIHNKKIWCEKTPQHLLFLDFIWELFPDSTVVHIKRDPRGVVQSMSKQRWAPSDLRNACLYMRAVYQRWRDLKEKLDLDRHRYIEFCLEDFAINPQPILSEIASVCEIEDRFDDLPEISIERVDYWKKTMTREELALVNELLGPEISSMGYAI